MTANCRNPTHGREDHEDRRNQGRCDVRKTRLLIDLGGDFDTFAEELIEGLTRFHVEPCSRDRVADLLRQTFEEEIRHVLWKVDALVASATMTATRAALQAKLMTGSRMAPRRIAMP